MKLDQVRHEQILERLSSERKIEVAAMADNLDVSMETIRRDLKRLEDRGLLRRIHGGAIPVMPHSDRPFQKRTRLAFREKALIAAQVIPLLRRGMSVFLDTGTTTLAVARAFSHAPPLTVFTNSVDIALVLSRQMLHEVRLTGGTMRADDNALIGYDAIASVRNYRFDLALMGIVGVDLDAGFMDYGDDEAELRRAAARQSSRSVILADHTKFGRPGRIRTFDFGAIDIVIADSAPPQHYRDALARAAVSLIHD